MYGLTHVKLKIKKMKKVLISATLLIGMIAGVAVFGLSLTSCSSKKSIVVPPNHGKTAYDKDPSIPKGEAYSRDTSDNPGSTALARTIIRWFFDS